MSTRWGEWSGVVVVASLAIIGCTGTTPGSECGGAGEACCAGSVCSGMLVCSAAGQCTAAGPTYTVGGVVSGLTGAGLALRNGAETLAISSAGAFTFAIALPAGSAYAVTIATQPSGQTCTVANGSGTVGSTNVTSVAVSCTRPSATTYTIGGTVSGLTGTGLVLQDNRADNLPIAASGAFTFATALTQGDRYAVTVLGQPAGQTCSVANGAGTVGTANVTDVAVTCVVNSTPRYNIGGTVSGLAGTGLVLRNNGGDDRPISANGAFTFATPLPGGAGYSVTVAGQPSGPSQTCTVSNAAGTVGNADVTGVIVHCVTNAVPMFTVGGTVTGLSGPGLVLRNNGGDDLAVATSGTFTFTTPLMTGNGYAVTVRTQPSGQTCTVSGGSGTVGTSNVTSVAVTCTTNPPPRYSVGGTITGLTGSGLVLRNNGGDDLSVAAGGPFVFATMLTSGSSYAVTILTQPSGQTCTVSNGSGIIGSANVTTVAVGCVNVPPPTYTVGGTVSGLAGSGLVLQDNAADNLAIGGNGPFHFPTALTSGDRYSVTVLMQPTGQTCTVSNGSGIIGNTDITAVGVSCVTNPLPRYHIGGTVSSLAGSGLVLRNNGGDDLSVAANGAFTFATTLLGGAGYAVTVAGQPSGPSQTCTVANGTGTVGSADVTTVTVSCVTNPLPRYTIGGTVTGLSGTGLVLRNNGGDDLAVAASGTFAFATSLISGSAYAVTVASQPSGQTCSVSGGSGTVNGANVTSVSVTCVTNPPPRFTIGGTVTGLTGSGLVLRNNSGDDLAVAGNGTFTFGTSLTSGSAYAVTIASQPSGQTCSVTNASGTVSGANVTNVAVSCVTNRYTVGGTVTGLGGSGLLLRNNGGDDLAVAGNGTFTFATSLPSGSTYAVTVASQPSGQTCSVSGGSGTVTGANVTSVSVSCVTNPPPRFTIGGTVAGLTGTGLVLRNNGGDDLAVSSNGAFTFATSLTSGSAYAVTVASQPSGQTCSVANGSGTVPGANVTSVSVSCASPPPTRPTLVQHVSSSTNLIGRGLIGNNYRFTLPNPVLAGNVLILGISYGAPAGQVVTVHDNQGNSWPASPAVSQTDPDGNIASAIFVLPNARAGITTVTVSFSSPIRETIFQYTISEFQGVAAAAPVSGTSRSSGAQPAISAGTFTPSNNDANGGNLIWSYFADSYGTTGFATEATRFTAGTGFTLLDADISWPTGSPPFPHASQYEVQSAAGPVTPSMTVTHNDGGGDVYVGVAVALRASPGAGTSPPPGMRIVHLSHLTNEAPDVGAWRLQFPSSGNLIVVTLQEQNIIPVASITDNLGNGYQPVVPDDSVPQFWFAQGPAATSPTLELTVTLTGGEGGGVTYLLYDIAGASTSSYDGFAFKTQYDDPTGSDVFDSPVITPLTAPGLTITATSFGQGPSSGLGAGCPAGAIFDLVYYTGETDFDTMDNADFRAHVFNTDRSTEHWNIAVSNGNNSTNVSSTAVHFK